MEAGSETEEPELIPHTQKAKNSVNIRISTDGQWKKKTEVESIKLDMQKK